MDNAAFHPWAKEFHTARFPQDIATQCFSEVMVKLLLVARITPIDNATFHPWTKESHTARFLQEIATQCFSEVMVKLLLVAVILMDNSAFHPWMKDFRTARFPQEGFTQCFSEVMVKLLLAAKNPMDDAAFHSCMKDFHTNRFRQEVSTQCFSEVMVKLLFAALILVNNAAFLRCGLGVTGYHLALYFRAIATFLMPQLFLFLGKDRVLQVDFHLEGDGGVILTCVGLDGLEVLRLKAQKSDRTVDVCSRVARELNTDARTLRLVLPDARLLATSCKANPFATLSDVISV